MQNSTKDNIIHQNVSRRPSPTKIVFVWLAATLIFGVFVGIGLSRYFALFETSRTGVSFNVINKSAPDNVVVKDLDMSKFWKVLGLVEDNYLDVSDVDPSDIVDGAINGMMAALGDPYTSYYSDEQNQGFKDDLEGVYGGVGAQLGFKDDRLAIIAPLEGSPAAAAGVRSGDFILAVDEESTTDWSLPKAVDEIRGEAGTIVTLTLQRGTGAAFDLKIERDIIKVPAVRLTWEEGNVAHLRILRFGSDTDSEWDDAVDEVLAKGANGVVLDVRGNPGGLLNSAIYIASDFFKDGVVVQSQTSNDITKYEVDHRCRLCDINVVVLADEGSASASEILAGALQARKRGEIVGVTTFGKGTVQEAIELNDGAAVHITTARWLLPNDLNIHGVGLTPDYEVKIEESASPFGDDTDAQVQKALEVLNNFSK